MKKLIFILTIIPFFVRAQRKLSEQVGGGGSMVYPGAGIPVSTGSAWGTSLSHTTVGNNLLNLTNPSAIRYLKINADNTVSTRTAAEMLSDIGAQASGSYAPATSGTSILKGNGSGGTTAASVGDFPTLNQNTTGSAATLTTARNINGTSFNGSANIDVTETETVYKQYTEFLAAATTMNPPYTGAAVASGTCAASTTNASGNRQGVVRITSSTTTNSGYRWQTDATSIRIKGGEEFTAGIAPVDLSANTTGRIGFLDNTTSADAVDGIYFEWAGSGNITLKTSNNSTRTTSSTITTMSANTWYKVKIVVNSNATSVTGYVYDASGTLISSQTNTTNIPTAAGRETAAGAIVTNVGTTATALCDLDFIMTKFTVTR